MQKDWYSPAEIRYTRDHNVFIILNLEDMSIGRWPPDPKETGYSDTQRRGISKHAHFEKACICSADVSYRLEFTKADGKTLKVQVQGGITDYELLEPEAQRALDFISLFDFTKRPKYYVWKKNRKYYRKRRLKLRPFSLNKNKRGKS